MTDPLPPSNPADGVASAALIRRLLNRRMEPLGVIDVHHAQDHYLRLAAWTAGRFPLLAQLTARCGEGDEVTPGAADMAYRSALAWPSADGMNDPLAQAAPRHGGPSPGIDAASEHPAPPADGITFRVRGGPPAPSARPDPSTVPLPHRPPGSAPGGGATRTDGATAPDQPPGSVAGSESDAQRTAERRFDASSAVARPPLTTPATPGLHRVQRESATPRPPLTNAGSGGHLHASAGPPAGDASGWSATIAKAPALRQGSAAPSLTTRTGASLHGIVAAGPAGPSAAAGAGAEMLPLRSGAGAATPGLGHERTARSANDPSPALFWRARADRADSGPRQAPPAGSERAAAELPIGSAVAGVPRLPGHEAAPAFKALGAVWRKGSAAAMTRAAPSMAAAEELPMASSMPLAPSDPAAPRRVDRAAGPPVLPPIARQREHPPLRLHAREWETLVERLTRVIFQKLAIEFERRGIRRWL